MTGAIAPLRQMPTPAEQEQYDLDVATLASMKEVVHLMVPGRENTKEEIADFFHLARGKRARVAAFDEKYRPRTSSPRPQEARGEYSGPIGLGGCIYSMLSPQLQSTMFQSPLFEQATALPEPSSLQRQEVASTDRHWLAYHYAMGATASGDADPTYNYVLGWQKTDVSFVQNPHHPYWCGRQLVRYLRATDALDNKDRPWYMADKNDRRGDIISLKHPCGVIDRQSYWAGLRDELQNQQLFFDDDWSIPTEDHIHHQI